MANEETTAVGEIPTRPGDGIHPESDPAQGGRALLALREVIRSFNVVTKKLERRSGLAATRHELNTSDPLPRTSGSGSVGSAQPPTVPPSPRASRAERRRADREQRRRGRPG